MPQRRSQDAPAPGPGPGRARPSRRRRDREAAASDQAAGAALPQSQAEGAALTVSLEAVLWGALLVAAFALRLARLDALPLTLEESSRAFAAFQVSQGTVPEGWSGDLASTLTALLFRLFGEGDSIARIVPALAGGALVGAFWFSGRYLGRGAALAAAALVALSPLSILVSRSGLAFSLGALLSMAMVLSLFAYLRRQRTLYLTAFVSCLALAPTIDAVATATAIAVAAFLLIEGALRGNEHIARAFATFRANPAQWGTTGLIAAAALLLGLTHFGTSLQRLGLAGLTQWADMFTTPGDGRFWGYQLTLLTAYDWPLALTGALGLLVGVRRLFGGGRPVSLFGRFALLWAAAAVAMVTLATKRESGQLLILLLPFALLAGHLLEEVISALDWSILRRSWLPLLAALVLITYALLMLTEWSQDGASRADRVFLVLALILAAGLIGAALPTLGRDSAAVPLTAIGVLATVFLVHSSLSVVLADGSEFADGRRAGESAEAFAASVAQASGDVQAPIVVDSSLRQPLEWYLRDESVAFGDAGPDTIVYVAPAGAEAPGFRPEGEPWRLAEGWFPPRVDILKMWRWLLYRTSFGNLSSTDAQIYLPSP